MMKRYRELQIISKDFENFIQMIRYNLFVGRNESKSIIGDRRNDALGHTEIKIEDTAWDFHFICQMNYGHHEQNSRDVDVVLHRILKKGRYE